MKLNPDDTLRAMEGLKDNGYFRHYVKMLEVKREDAIKELLYSSHPDECLRGKARAIDEQLKELRTKWSIPS